MFSCRLRRYAVVYDSQLYRHPEDYVSEINSGAFMEIFAEDFSCDACDKSFDCEREYDIHMSYHKVCNLDGCTFSAHEKIIELHIRLQHSTGLYDKIRNVNTSEDISKWVEERKKRYPNKMNIQKRYEEQEEQLKRGERIVKHNKRFGHNEFTSVKNKPKKKTVQKKKIKRKKLRHNIKGKSLINEQRVWNNMIPFKGTVNLYTPEVIKDEEKYEDEEWNAPTSKNIMHLNNSLGALMGAYMSDNSDENESSVKNDSIVQNDIYKVETNKTINNECVSIQTNIIDDEPPTEIKIEKIVSSYPYNVTNKVENKKEAKKNNERKSFGNNFKKGRKTLLEKLLENDIRRERNILLQCVRYVINKNCFR